MRKLISLAYWIVLAAMPAGLPGCGAAGDAGSGQQAAVDTQAPQAADPALLATLQQQLLAELAALGKEPGRSPSTPPAGNDNAVFNMQLSAQPPDGIGGQGSSELLFYPRLLGDYDGNGEVGISDITPLGKYFGQTVQYDDPELHGGIKYWPTGEPDGAGRDNWLKARVDGDGNGEINAADITPIAVHFQEHADGWRVELRLSAEDEFSLLPHPEDAELLYSVRWQELQPDSIGYLLPAGWPDSGYLEMRIQAWEHASESGGPFSAAAIFEQPAADCTAFLQADQLIGDFPLTVNFSASGSSVVADSYLLDFGDGNSNTVDSLADFPLEHTYTAGAAYEVLFTVNCGLEQATDSLQIIATPLPCDLEVNLAAMPVVGFAPLNVLFDPVGTTAGAESYELDFGDGSALLAGSSLAEMAVAHVYETSGEFTASLSAICLGGGTVEATRLISVGNTADDCSVNLSIENDHIVAGGEAAFFFAETTGNAGLLDFGDGSDVMFLNLQGPEPLFHTYAEAGTFLAELSIQCNDAFHSDSVLVFVQPLPVQTFDATGTVYQYESNPPIGGPEPDKFELPGVEMEIYDLTDEQIMGTTLTGELGVYFFDGSAIGLDVSHIFIVRPSQAEINSRLPLEWFPGQAFIVDAVADTLKECSDINLLATAT